MRKDAMELSDELKDRIRESLKALHREKAIVFGSYAHGGANRDSDLDLIVVLDSCHQECRMSIEQQACEVTSRMPEESAFEGQPALCCWNPQVIRGVPADTGAGDKDET